MALIQKSVKKGNVNSNRNENAIVDDVKNLIDTTSNAYELLSYSTNSSNITIYHYIPNFSRFVMLGFQVPSLNLNKLYTYYVDKFSYVNVVVEGTNPNLTVNNENISSIYVGHLNNLNTVTFNFNGKYFDSINYGSIATFNVPNLIAVNQLAAYIPTITDCYFPSLKFITGYFGLNGNFTSISAPLLEASNNAYFQYSNNVTTINLPSLKYVLGDFNISSLPSLTTFNVNSLEFVSGQFIIQNNGFFTMPIPSSIKGLGGYYVYIDNLSQAYVDASLIKLASLDGTNGTLIFRNANVYILGTPPSAAGLTAKATLISRGCSVTTN